MRILTTLIFIAALITAANAEPIKLQDFSIKDVESRCLKVHGEFISHDDGSYGCTYFKGTIKCNAEQHCTGVLKEVQHHKASPPKKRHIHPYYHGYRHWYPYQQW